jgi:hypothetical protein
MTQRESESWAVPFLLLAACFMAPLLIPLWIVLCISWAVHRTQARRWRRELDRKFPTTVAPRKSPQALASDVPQRATSMDVSVPASPGFQPLASDPPPRPTSMGASAPASFGLHHKASKWLNVGEPEYRVRHIPTEGVPELMHLYRSASDEGCCARMVWAAKEYVKEHPETNPLDVFEDLDRLISDRQA